MYEIFDPAKTYTMPDGTSADGAALEKDFPLCTSAPFAAIVHDGVLTELTRLGVLRDAYGVEAADPKTAVDAVNAEVRRRNDQREIDGEAVETTQQAVAELGVMTATGMESAAELGTMTATSMESVAELGATVAALTERVAALEAK